MADETTAIAYLHDVHAPLLLGYLARLARVTTTAPWTSCRGRSCASGPTPGSHAEGHWNRAWLFTVARRIAIDGIRARSVRPAEVADERIGNHAVAEDDIEKMLDANGSAPLCACCPSRCGRR